jgi:hypothetical protein
MSSLSAGSDAHSGQKVRENLEPGATDVDHDLDFERKVFAGLER